MVRVPWVGVKALVGRTTWSGHEHETAIPGPIVRGYDRVADRAAVVIEAGSDEDRHATTGLPLDQPDMHRCRTDGRVVRVDIRPPDVRQAAVGGTDILEQLPERSPAVAR